MRHETIYLLTDGCMWEANKRNGTTHPHAMEVVDIKTGAVRYITSGSKIAFIEGEITDIRTQKAYNKATSKVLPHNKQSVPQGEGGEEKGGAKL